MAFVINPRMNYFAFRRTKSYEIFEAAGPLKVKVQEMIRTTYEKKLVVDPEFKRKVMDDPYSYYAFAEGGHQEHRNPYSVQMMPKEFKLKQKIPEGELLAVLDPDTMYGITATYNAGQNVNRYQPDSMANYVNLSSLKVGEATKIPAKLMGVIMAYIEAKENE